MLLDEAILGYPYVSLLAVADGRMKARSNGRIYFYVCKWSEQYKDLVKWNMATLMFSGALGDRCITQPMDEICMRAILSGVVNQVRLDGFCFQFKSLFDYYEN